MTHEEYAALHTQGWVPREVRREDWDKIPGLPRRQDVVAVMASGCPLDPQRMHGMDVVAGIDVLVLEPRPRPGEPPGNAYHLVVRRSADPRWPYLVYSYFETGTIPPHWFYADHLDRYPRPTT